MPPLKSWTTVRMNLFFFVQPESYYFLTLSLSNSSAPSTIALLGGPLSAKHDSYRNKRFLQEGICAEKQKEAPAGFQWKGQSESSKVPVRVYGVHSHFLMLCIIQA